jgi:hypothetical protein
VKVEASEFSGMAPDKRMLEKVGTKSSAPGPIGIEKARPDLDDKKGGPNRARRDLYRRDSTRQEHEKGDQIPRSGIYRE